MSKRTFLIKKPFSLQAHDDFHRKMLNRMARQLQKNPNQPIAWEIRNPISQDFQQQYTDLKWHAFHFAALVAIESIALAFRVKSEITIGLRLGFEHVDWIDCFFIVVLTALLVWCCRVAYLKWQVVKELSPQIQRHYMTVYHVIDFKQKIYTHHHDLDSKTHEFAFQALHDLPALPPLSQYTDLDNKMCAFIQAKMRQAIFQAA